MSTIESTTTTSTINDSNPQPQNSPNPIPSLQNFYHDANAPIPPILTAGSLTLILGEPGAGKSLLALDLAARLTTNSAPPPHPHLPRPPFAYDQLPEYASIHDYQPASVMILSREDSFHTLAVRILTAGADRERLSIPKRRLSLIPPKPNRYDPTPQIPLSSLEEYLNESLRQLDNPRLLILDPLPSFLGRSDGAHPFRVRTLLEPLLETAQDHHLAILGISHLNKSTHLTDPLHRNLGSQVYPALARSVFLLTPDQPTDHCAHPQRRLLIPLKSNLGPTDRALAFSITPTGTLLWEPSPITNHPLLQDPHNQSHSSEQLLRESQLQFALRFLQTTLSRGPIPSTTLLKQARAIGISQRTLERARFHLNIDCTYDYPTARWLTHLPNNLTPQPTPTDFAI